MEIDNNIFSGEYKIIEGTETSKPDKDINKEIELDAEEYPITKPRRVIIKTKIIP